MRNGVPLPPIRVNIKDINWQYFTKLVAKAHADHHIVAKAHADHHMIWSLFFLQSNDITYTVWTGPVSGFWERWCSSPAIHLYIYETKFLSILRFLWPISDVFLSIFLIFPQQHLFCHSNQQLINIVRQGRRCLYEFSIQGCCMVFAIYIKKVSTKAISTDIFPSTEGH